MTCGAFWGAFDPPTTAHGAIVKAALEKIPMDRLYIIVNNHPYKNYDNDVKSRLSIWQKWLQAEKIKDVELLSQDDAHQWDVEALKQMTCGEIVAIAGYDAYNRWRKNSDPQDLARFKKIAVVPRGDEPPILYEENTIILGIDSKYRHISSGITKKLNRDKL